jgi:hypothetical protein
MTKSQLENLLRRAGEIARDRDFFLTGSQALRGICKTIPKDFPVTIEADLYPRHHPEAWAILRAQLGQTSRFFNREGYYLDCTDPALSTLPEGWIERLVPFRTPRTGGVTAWCLEPNDLFIAKLNAWRPKDRRYLLAMLGHKFVKPSSVTKRLETSGFPGGDIQELQQRLDELLKQHRKYTRKLFKNR